MNLTINIFNDWFLLYKFRAFRFKFEAIIYNRVSKISFSKSVIIFNYEQFCTHLINYLSKAKKN